MPDNTESRRADGSGAGRIECRVDGPVSEWLIDNPPVNALNRSMLRALLDACEKTRADSRIRAVVITGAGSRCFSAGADMRELLRMDVAEAMARAEVVCAVFDALAELPLPTICACNGSAVGGGFEMALMCDVVIASANARFGLPELRAGVVPAALGLRRLAEALGYPRARALVYTTELISAAEALSLGVVHRVVDGGDVVPAAWDLARQMARHSPSAFRIAKELFSLSDDIPRSALRAHGLNTFRRLLGSAELREGLEAFLERRTPDFTRF